MKRRAVISCVYLGFFSQVAQVVVLREALTTFAGVEMALGLTLCVWLVAVGCGGFAGNKIGLFRRRWFSALSALYLLAGVLLPATILAIRYIPEIFGFAAGEIVGPTTSLFGAALVLTPLCFLLGLLFAANARIYREAVATWVGTVYLLEALGAAGGGLIVTFVFIPLFSHLAASLVILFWGACVVILLSERRMPRFIPVCAVLLIALLALTGSPSLLYRLDVRTRTLDRAVGRVQAVSDSPYGQLAVTTYGDQYSLYVNGTLAASYPDWKTAEEAVHFALLLHETPQSVLLIGGGGAGAISEILKHGVNIDYVELDPELIRLTQEHFPPEAVGSLDSCRIIYQDARAYLSHTETKYDVIILNLGEPSTALTNRFFTREFFFTARDHLSSGGVFSFRVPSSESYISPERELFLSSLFRTLSDVFPEIVVLPGPNNVFVATDRQTALIRDPDVLADRIHERGVNNKFVNEYLLPFRLTDAAYDFLGRHLDSPDAKANTDLRPVCYFYDAILWNLHFAGPQKWILSRLAGLAPGAVWTAWGLVILLVFVLCVLYRRKNTVPFLFSLFVTGLTGMAMEVVLLFGFQIYLGYIYGKIGLLVACFMVGLSGGSYLITRHAVYSARTLMVFQFLPGVGAMIFLGLTTSGMLSSLSPLLVEILFYLLSLIFGFFGGALFVVANGLFMERLRGGGLPPVGTGYGVDLMGSALGALAVSSILIPVWGIPLTIWLMVVLNLAVIAAVAIFFRRGASAAVR